MSRNPIKRPGSAFWPCFWVTFALGVWAFPRLWDAILALFHVKLL